MAKRRINEQQQRRIANIQQKRREKAVKNLKKKEHLAFQIHHIKGKGAKILLTPPGYDKPIPEGYIEVKAYATGFDPKDPLVSLVFGDYTGVTPMFLFCGTSELLGSHAIRIAANARSQGCDVTLYVNDGMWRVSIIKMGDVPVLDIKPQGWKDNGKVLVYIHGGAYTMFSARSTLNSSAPMARATGLRIISVDYTTAPFANWKEIQEQVIVVFKVLNEQGYAMEDIALYGDSAGGGLAASTVINLRDRGMGMPAAVALLSPWVDISDAGDTMKTLEYTDPSLHYNPLLKSSAMAYADGLPLTDPHVSALYGDFSKGFSPAIISEGTKCIFLSTSVRLYQTLEAAGQDAKLDVYEGMWHVFQLAPSPETDVSLKKISIFFHQHLNK